MYLSEKRKPQQSASVLRKLKARVVEANGQRTQKAVATPEQESGFFVTE